MTKPAGNLTRFIRSSDQDFKSQLDFGPFAGLADLHKPSYRDGLNSSHYFNYLDDRGRKLTVQYEVTKIQI